MSVLLQRLYRHVHLRFFLNILLWVVVSYTIFNMNRTASVTINLYKTVSVVSLLLFTYTNNLYLIPRFLARRRFFAYWPLALLLILIYSLLYSLFLWFVEYTHPGIQRYQVVLLSVGGDDGVWNLEALTDTTAAYFFVYGLWLFIMTLAWYMHDHARQQKVMQSVLQKQMETELNFLKAQINPHFLFNTLNNLYGLALRKSDQSPDAILKLSSILRYLLYESNTPTVSFEKEKEIMQAYIDIELLRLDDTEKMEFHLSADGPAFIPPLLWLPVLENVFKHGARTIHGDHELVFRFEIRDRQLLIYSKNKQGRLGGTPAEQGGIGLENLRKRLELLYPGKHSISVVQENNDYISEVKIDLS